MKKRNNNNLSDLYKNAFNMMITAFQTDNIYDSLYLTLYEAKNYISAESIILYKLDSNNTLKHFLSTEYNNELINNIISNHKKQIINKKHYISTSINDNNVIFIPIELNKNSKYILLIINNYTKDNKTCKKIIKVYTKAFETILRKMESLYQLKKQIEIDYLTQFGNRVSYEKELTNIINSNKSNFIYTLIDLFRLKYVNDNINHAAGDEYIKQVATLLSKYFPKYQTKLLNDNKNIGINTGNYLYRIGGDEFVLITMYTSKREVINNLEKLKKELLKLNLDKSSNPTLCVNYGIVEKKKQTSLEELYKEADIYLANDKQKMYRKLNIDRRT